MAKRKLPAGIDPLDLVAGNGLLDRRALLRGGAALAGAATGIGLTGAGA
jgi:hypothetical protein